MFEDASDIDMRKASSQGDVCCICLGSMSTTSGGIKKVGCGHLYHTHCLREVVERARSMEAARCPLCRASVLDGRPSDRALQGDVANNNNVGGAAVADNNNNAPINEHALFRFSTEGILPAWMPLPAFSFEVVRRPTIEANDNTAAAAVANNNNEDEGDNDNQPQQPQSFWRRLLTLAGAIPLSPEEEQQALESLVDMFPQYDRADLQRELRSRGNAEGVVEAVMVGTFQGVPRGLVEVNEREADGPEQ